MALRTASCFPPSFTRWSPTEHEVGAVRLSPALETRGGYRLKRGRTPRHLLSSYADNGPKFLLRESWPNSLYNGDNKHSGTLHGCDAVMWRKLAQDWECDYFPSLPSPLKEEMAVGFRGSWLLNIHHIQMEHR